MKPKHEIALDILKANVGELLLVELQSGRVCKILNIAWGYDLGEPSAHITTNISPQAEDEDGIEYPSVFFHADEVVRITVEENQAVLFESTIN